LYAAPTDKIAIDLPTYLRQLPYDCHETILYMGAKERLPVRILFQKLPPQVVEERRRKAKRTAERTLKRRTQRHLDLLAWSIFITNVPDEMLTFEQVLLLYRVRWQIELLFKLWKSYAQVTAFGCWRSERILCQLYAKMILMVLFQWMINPQRVVQSFELSYPKAFQLLQLYHVYPLLLCIRQRFRNFNSFLNAFLRDLAQYARKDRRRKQPSTYNLIWAASLTRLG